MKKKLSILAFVILISVGGMIFSKSFTKQEQLKLSTKGLDDTTIYEVEESKDNPILDDDKKITVTEEEKSKEKLKENKEELKEDKDKDKTKENKETINEKDSVENKKSQSETKISEPSKESKGETQSSESKNNEVNTETKNNTNVKPKQPEKKQEPNVIIVNDITGDVIASEYVNIEGQKVEAVTKKFLNDSGITPPVVKSGYFSSIAGLKERSEGKSSGWCYYVNGVKPGIGASAYTLKKGDKLVWKFLLDGINN